MKILLVEDQNELAENIKTYLQLDSFHVEVTTSGQEGYERILEETFDGIILDLNLPDKDGMEICREVRNHGITTPILMLTARSAKDSIITGLTTGADDYITKPFDMEVLSARIKSAIRRSRNQPNPLLTFKNIIVDTNTKSVKKDDQEVRLSPKEYLLLEYLLLNKNKALDRESIIEHVWGEFDALMFSQTVDVHISYLRKKLSKDTIKTVPGGYMISD